MASEKDPTKSGAAAGAAGDDEHAWFRERMAAFVAGGLGDAERARMEAHMAGCADCGEALADLAWADSALGRLFAGVRPDAGFEDRVVRGLWSASHRRFAVHPAVWKAAAGLAAALVVGAVGYVNVRMLEGRPLFRADRAPAAQQPQASASAQRDRLRAAPSTEPGASRSPGQLRYRSPEEEARERTADVYWGLTGQAVNGKASEQARTGLSRRWDDAARDGREKMLGAAARGFYQDLDDVEGSGERQVAQTDRYLKLTQPRFVDVPGLATATEQPVTTAPREATALHMGFAPPGALGGPAPVAATAETGAGGAAVLDAAKDGEAAGGFGGGGAAAPEYFRVDVLRTFADRAEQRNGRSGAQQGQAAPGMEGKRTEELAKVTATLGAGTGLAASGTTTYDGAVGSGSGTAGDTGAAPATGAAPGGGGTGGQAAPPQQPPQAVEQSRKVIRNGEIEFEVDSFDSTFVTVSRIVGEEGGFVSSTNSEKLANGKVRGTIIVRVPPERLDTLVLKLRALGDLKAQRISAQDVTKKYYDLESELRAARAMEKRLLSIIESGKGEIKDLLEAEKQLGVYREKIEKLEGEKRYYDNLVAMSTLSITATERSIGRAAVASQTETVSMGIESEDVEKSRADALKAIEEAKGRVIESNLKKHDAGQFAATVVAEVAPDAAGPLIDRLKQLGRVARLDADRRQSTPEGRPVLPGATVERKDARLTISIYNLANVAPRQTTNLNLAVANVEETYRAVLSAVADRKGRVVSSNLNRQKPEQTTATVQFEVPAAEADAVLAEVRRDRDVMSMTVVENPDTQNVTSAKRGFVVQVFSLATVPARETEQLVIATRAPVAEVFRAVLAEARKADARILTSTLNEQDKANPGGTLDLEVTRAKELDVRQALATAGDVLTRNVVRSPDAENRVDSKVLIQVRLVPLERLQPREQQNVNVASRDVPASYAQLLSGLAEAGARVTTSQLNEQDRRNVTGKVEFEVLRADRERAEKALAAAGAAFGRSVTRSSDTVNTVDSKVAYAVSLQGAAALPPREEGAFSIVVADVAAAVQRVSEAATAAGGRVSDSQLSTEANGRVGGVVVIDVPLRAAAGVRNALEGLGEVRVRDTTTNPGAPDGEVGRATFKVTLGTRELIVGHDEGLGATLRNALRTSAKGLLVSLQVLVVGLLFVVPWVLILWFAWKLVKRSRARAAADLDDRATTPPPPPATATPAT